MNDMVLSRGLDALPGEPIGLAAGCGSAHWAKNSVSSKVLFIKHRCSLSCRTAYTLNPT